MNSTPSDSLRKRIFISGGTGYMGRALADRLLERGHEVRVLARAGSEKKVPAGASAVPGDALQAETFADKIGAGSTVVHLTGTPHPAPWKERSFRAIDLASLQASVHAAERAQAAHFIYVSVAQPAPVMKAYQRVRKECEGILSRSGLRSTILRPWYVLGRGHWWPVALRPLYALFESMPSTRESAERLGLVTLAQMVQAMVWAVENPPGQTNVMGVREIRKLNVSPGARQRDLAEAALVDRPESPLE